MIVQKPQFDPSFFKIGLAIIIGPGPKDGKHLMRYYFGSDLLDLFSVPVLVKEVRPFEIDVIFMELSGQVEEATIKVADLVKERLVIHLNEK